MGNQRSIRLTPHEKTLLPGDDEKPTIWQPIDAKWKTKGNANYELSVAINIDCDDLLSPPVRKPKMVVAPTWRFTHRKTRQQDLDVRFRRLFWGHEIYFTENRDVIAAKTSALFEIALMLVRLDHVTSRIVNAD